MEGINYRFPFNPSCFGDRENGGIETCDIAESITSKCYAISIAKRRKPVRRKLWKRCMECRVHIGIFFGGFGKCVYQQFLKLSDYRHRLVILKIKAHIVL